MSAINAHLRPHLVAVVKAEVAADDPAEADVLIARYQALFGPYLGPPVGTSNEDLLRP